MKAYQSLACGSKLLAAMTMGVLVIGKTLGAPAENAAPTVRWLLPPDGTTMALGETVTLEAVAEDADGYASYMEFYAGPEKIGESQIYFFREPDPGSPITHNYEWTPREAGTYVLTVRAMDNLGLEGLSPTLGLTVVDPGTGRPRITSIRVENGQVVVVCDIPAGLKKITLESRSRAVTGAWQPKAIQRLGGQSGSVTFQLEKSASLELLRVRGDAQEALPAAFYTGKTNFNGPVGMSYPMRGLEFAVDDINAVVPGGSERAVVESDIWSVRGKTLYFFNQYRGLQVIDLTQIDAPVVKATLPLPAVGEQMYVIEDRYVILLARDTTSTSGYSQSEIMVVDVTGTPAIVARLPVTGTIQESRMVGQALYVASETYRQYTVSSEIGDPKSTGESVWEWGSVVASFDLSHPAAPVAKNTLWYPGYGNVIQATDRFLLVSSQSTTDYWQSNVRLLDISAPDGTMTELATISPAGRVADKFKMNIANHVLSIISEAWNGRWGTDTTRASVLQTFSLADPRAPEALGKLTVGQGEGLYATRFDGDRVYIVTFLRIDPLWIVDLKDPANPKLTGELEVPGYSTYIHPLGNRLVTIGLDNSNSWKVAVSLFDVQDPAKPALLSKVPLGENSSWSEATEDEKAFTVLPGAGLIMVPDQSWGTNGYAARVQLIDLGTDTLQARGVIEHSLQPRRTTVVDDRILSISGREMMTVNAVDRDHPLVTSMLELSWRVDRVFLAGDYLIEVSEGESWNGQANPVLRVVKKNQTDEILGRYELTNGFAVVGGTLKGEWLYLLQAQTDTSDRVFVDTTAGESVTNDPTSTLVLNVFNLSQLPQLQLVGQSVTTADPLYYNADFHPVWPKPNVLVWAGSGGSYWRNWYLVADFRMGYWPWWGSSSPGRLFAYEVASPANPALASEVNLAGTNNWWSFSQAHSTGSLVYLSHQGSEFIPGVIPAGYDGPRTEVIQNEDGTLTTNALPVGVWVTKHYLDVIDYADPAHPEVRPPVNVPGQLTGLSHDGALLYTIGNHWDSKWVSDGFEYLDASAYDGLQVSLVDSLKLTNSWPRPISLPDAGFAGVRSESDGTGGLVTWQFTTAGKFQQLADIKLPTSASSLKAWGGLLAVYNSPQIGLYDIRSLSTPAFLTSTELLGWTWPDLEMADGELSQGLWVPLNDYGVVSVPIGGNP